MANRSLFPCAFPRDAWTRLPDRDAGQIFLGRVPGQQTAVALHSWHGVYRAAVRYDEHAQCYCSCCYRVRFGFDGRMLPDEGISPVNSANMTRLETKVAAGRVLVRHVMQPGD